uniref:Uncharacterized protein n=1 Tax=Anguilla anguilla TaxID=7936 RepID=A0A0E9QD09_ANGAN
MKGELVLKSYEGALGVQFTLSPCGNVEMVKPTHPVSGISIKDDLG